HAEEIKNTLSAAGFILSGDENGNILDRLRQVNNMVGSLKSVHIKSAGLADRLETLYIELKDIASETESLAGSIENDPGKLEIISQRLDLLFSLMQKHRVQTVKELIIIRNRFEERIAAISSYDYNVREVEKKLREKKKIAEKLASGLSESRKNTAKVAEKKITVLLRQMGMPNATFSIGFEKRENLSINGMDNISFLFSANRKVTQQEISKIASGGEISRLMLAIKSLVAQSVALPTIILDEIDMGVSGETADKTGNIMHAMSKTMQVIAITHIPQIAGKGDRHYMVYKQESVKGTSTHIMLLSPDDRILEIARMLSGEQLTPAAMENAKELLKKIHL
ncbi:MAG: DNA repair protein RecN, partial [Bacteroidetes bacterium]|nr:DNA repair protein RecN [Bacteroidota bacterium]